MKPRRIARKLTRTLQAGGADSEVYIQETVTTNISAREGKIDRLKQATIAGMGVRAIYAGRLFFIHTSQVGDQAFQEITDRCLRMGQIGTPEDANVLPEKHDVPAHELEIWDPKLEEIPLDRKKQLVLDVEREALAASPLIRRVDHVSYRETRSNILIANSNDVLVEYPSTKCGIYLSAIAERDGELQPGEVDFQARHFDDLPSPEEAAGISVNKAVMLLGGKPIPSCRLPVVFSNWAGRVLLIHLFNALRGDRVNQGRSFLEGRLAEKIGSELVTMIDDGLLKRGVGTAPVDAEGVPRVRQSIIESGVLGSFLYDTGQAKLAGTQSTGSARRRSYMEIPEIGASNLFLAPGTMTEDDLIASTGEGLYVDLCPGFWVGIDPATGGFSTGAAGVRIRDGALAEPVARVTLASTVEDMLLALDGVADNLQFFDDITSPSFRIAEMSIGGV